MKLWILAVAIFAAVSLASAQTNKQTNITNTQTNIEQTLQALEREWANAVVHRDASTINHLQADEFEFTDPSGQVWTKSRAIEFIKSGRLQIDSFEMSEFRIRIYGDTAVVNFRVMWNGKADDNDISGPQRMTDVFVKRDGRWLCVSSQTTRIQM